MTLGYDQAVALPAMQSDGQGGQDELFKETNKVFDLGKGRHRDGGQQGGRFFRPEVVQTPEQNLEFCLRVFSSSF